jgi:nucleoside-triphosphatase
MSATMGSTSSRSVRSGPEAELTLIEGRPGTGKTTVALRLAERLEADGVPVSGFVTEELREGRRRVGFELRTLDGERGMLAHVDFKGGPRVGRYGVRLDDLERLAVPRIAGAREDCVVIVDELGKMELASEPFREAVLELLDRPVTVIATVHAFRHPFTDALKRRPGVALVRLTQRNRDRLPDELAAT